MVVYLDTNLITRLKKPDNEITKKLSSILLDDNKFILFYSDVHIQDLMENKSKSINEYIKQDLKNISEITKNRFLYNSPLEQPILSFQTPQESFCKLEPISITLYDSFDVNQNEFLKYSFQNTPVDISWYANSNEVEKELYQKYFSYTIKKMNLYALITDVNNFNKEIYENPNVYNELRDFALSKYKVSKNIINNVDDLKQFINNKLLKIDKLDFDYLLEKSLNIDFILNINKSLYEFMMRFIFTDMFGYFSEKFNKKNKYKNFYLDMNHGYLGQLVDFFITNDKHTLEKCKVIYKETMNTSQSFSPEEFIKFYNTFLFKPINENFTILNLFLGILDEKKLKFLYSNEFRIFTFFNVISYTNDEIILSYFHNSKFTTKTKEYQNMILYFDEIFENRIESNFENINSNNIHEIKVVWVYRENRFSLQYMHIIEAKLELLSLVITEKE